jgi:hypothetical protein
MGKVQGKMLLVQASLTTLLLMLALPTVAQFPTGEPPHPTNLYTCFSTYALCISAPCTEIPQFTDDTDDTDGTDGTGNSFQATQALCECEVVTGYNIGADDCATRAEIQAQPGYLISTYSVAQTAAKGLLSCDGPAVYADCFNFPCQIDENNPARAHCTCPILPGKGGYVTRGGDCDQANCSKLWSAAPAQGNTVANGLLWRQLGFTKEPPPGFTATPPENLCPAPGS